MADIADTKLGGIYIEIQARMGKLESDLKQVEARMRGVDNSGAKLSSTISTLGKYLSAGAIAYGLLNIGKSALSAAANMEQQKVAFTSMLGSAEKAQKLLDQMQSFAASTPFEFNEIVEAGKKLVAFGEDSENVTKTLGKIGDVAAGLGIPLGELTEIYGKARVQQTLYAEDLNQLAGRGIPIFEELGKVMNVNTSEVKKLGSEGKISFSMLEQVFGNLTSEGGKFAGLMDAQSKTLAGQWSNFNDQLGQTAILFGDALAPIAESVLSAISHRLKNINQLILNINDSIESNKLDAMLEDYKSLQKEAEKINASLWKRGIQTVGAREEALKGGDKEVAKLRAIQKQTEELHGKIITQQKARANSYKAAGGVVDESINKQINAEKKETEKKPTAAGAGESPWKKRQAEAQKYFETLKTINTSTDDPVKKVEQEIAALNEGMNKVSDMYKNGEIKKKQYEETLASYSEARIKKEEELEQAKFDRMREYYNLGVSTLTGFSGQINELASMYASNQTTRIEQEAQKRTDALNAEYEEQVALIEASAASDSQKAEQKKALDEQLARDTKAINDKAEKDKRKAQRESAKIQKDLAIFDTLITTPQAAMNAFNSLSEIPVVGYGLGMAAAAATTALGLAKLKLIQDQPLPALAEGGIVPAIPGGRQITVAEGGNSEGVIPFNERGVDILAQAMEKAISKIGGGSGATNVYIDSELIYSNMYEASRRGAVKIDQRAIV